MSATAPPLSAEPAREKGVTAGETKQLTILFADLAGSTALCEGLTPEEVHDLINTWVQVITEEIYRQGGIVTEFAGDAVMAIFGAPIAYEDAPQRAVRAGLAMQQAVRRFNEQRGTALQMRVGVDTGESFVGAVGSDLRSEYTALGHRANLAKRVQEVAERGSVTVSEETHKLVAAYFRTIEAGEFAAKGLSKPLRVFRILGEQRARSRLDVTLGRWQPRLVGRERQLEQLARHLERLAGGERQLVLIEGEPGIGKSRLALELRKLAGNAGMPLWEGRAQPHGEKLAYAIFADAVRRLCGIEEDDEPSVVQRKLHAATGAHLGADVQFLEALLSVDADSGLRHLDPETRKSGIFATVTKLIRARAAQGPLILLLDDFHWADPLSQELAEFIVQAAGEMALFFCLLARPGGVGLPSLPRFGRVSLSVLGPEETTDMILSLLSLPREPSEIAFGDWIYRMSGGNPLFIEEVLQAALSEGVLVPRGNDWEIAGDIGRIHVPGTLQDLIASRIDRLPAEEKSALQHAAVIGDEFRLDLLEELVCDERIGAIIAGLARHEFVVAAEPPGTYHFKHGLTWQVAYNSMPRRLRAPVHERVARLIEELHHDRLERYEALLAHHYDLSPNAAKAVFYLRRAGESAARVFANAAAEAYFSQALEKGSNALSHEERNATLLARGEVRCRFLGKYDDAIADFDAAISAAGAARDDRALARALLAKANAYLCQYRWDDALAWIAEALSRTSEAACPERVEALLRKAHALAEKGEFADALECSQQGLSLSRALQSKSLEIQALNRIARLHTYRCEFARALDAFAECIRLCGEVGDKASLSHALHNEALVYLSQLDHDRFIEVNARLQELLEEIGDQRMLAYSFFNLGIALQSKGDDRAAVECHEEAIRRLREIGICHQAKVAKAALTALGALYEKLGDAEKQIDSMEQRVALLEEEGGSHEVADALEELGALCLRGGHSARAVKCFAEAARLQIDAEEYERARLCLERALEAKKEGGGADGANGEGGRSRWTR